MRTQLADQTVLFDESVRDLRWFLLPSEAYDWLHNSQHAATKPRVNPPFTPITYPRQDVPTPRKIVPPDTQHNKTNDTDLSQCNDTNSNNEDGLSKVRSDFQDGLIQSLTSGFTQDTNMSTQPNNSASRTTSLNTNQNKVELLPPEKSDLLSSSDSSVNSGPSSGDKRPPDEGTVCEKSSKIPKTSSKSDIVEKGAIDADRKSDLSVNVTPENAHSDGTGVTPRSSQETSHVNSTKPTAGPDVKGEKKGFVCMDGACLQKRTTNAASLPDAPGGKHKWRSPPKHIFKPTTQVKC